MASKEWPGSGSAKPASSEKWTTEELGSEVEMGLDSAPVTPSISGLRDFIHPSMWSNERFSWTNTTTVLIGQGEAMEFQVGEEEIRVEKEEEEEEEKRRFCGKEWRGNVTEFKIYLFKHFKFLNVDTKSAYLEI